MHRHHRHFALDKLLQNRLLDPSRHHDDAIDAFVEQHFQIARLAFGAFVGVAHHQVVVLRLERRFQLAHNLGEEVTGDIGHEYTDGMRNAGLQPACHRTGPIVQIANGIFDRAARFG